MRSELAIALLVILGLPHGLQQETENVNQTQETREQKTGEQQCPTWFVPWSNHTDDCKCGAQMEGVMCDDHSNQSAVVLGSCVTYNQATNETVVGHCPYNSHKADFGELYVKLPQNISLLNEFMCSALNRTGILCSHCKEGLGIPVFSYTLHCLSCLESLSGWLLYIFLAVFPTTIFFLIVIVFQVRVTSAPMNAFIFWKSSYLCSNKFTAIHIPECITIYPNLNNCTVHLLWILEFGLLSLLHPFLLCE